MKASDNISTTYEYTTFPRRFVSYRWFKPILVALLTGVFMLVFQVMLVLVASLLAGDLSFADTIGNGYDDMNLYTGPGALAEFGSIAVLLPALALAVLIVRDRPYSSYSSSRGGWNWSAFLKCLAVAVALLGVVTVIRSVVFPSDVPADAPTFTAAGIVMCLVLVPLQCVAEEYIFRGLVMQTVGAWTKVPAIAIAVSAAVFAAGHPYNEIGVIAIFINGLIWGTLVWKTKGLEASSAMHIVNNMIAFGMVGFGLETVTSEIDVASLVVDALTCLAFAALIVVADRKFNWFTAKRDGTEEFNRKKLERAEQKRAGASPLPQQPVSSVADASPGAGASPLPQQPVSSVADASPGTRAAHEEPR